MALRLMLLDAAWAGTLMVVK